MALKKLFKNVKNTIKCFNKFKIKVQFYRKMFFWDSRLIYSEWKRFGFKKSEKSFFIRIKSVSVRCQTLFVTMNLSSTWARPDMRMIHQFFFQNWFRHARLLCWQKLGEKKTWLQSCLHFSFTRSRCRLRLMFPILFFFVQ